jgi:glyoxylase-like metal-dependent hydrolase (beta-lactamase superfamily II)
MSSARAQLKKAITMGIANVWRVGAVKITRVAEADDFALDPEFIFKTNAESMRKHEWLIPDFITPKGEIIVSIHAFVIDTGLRRIVVDTCIGNDKKRHTAMWNNLHGPFLEDLKAAGYPAETIDTVVCTHLHVDHVGWNTRWVDGHWLPTFPNARYLFGRVEWEHWQREIEAEAATAKSGDSHAANLIETGTVMGDSVLPIIQAGLQQLVEVDHRVSDEITLEHTPGHTPGHVAVRISSQGENAVITGDLMHHPVQCSAPELGTHVDWDSLSGEQTRRRFLYGCADKPVLVLGSHFAKPTAGWVVSHGGGWRFSTKSPS